ncbi:MAG: protein translocase subunit SecD [Alphaproteobacteria bacterium]|nr:protein translocase subunit SecD [Alphaproteobacteria bacterium]QQS56701.1 MAG: protein translocase subunit SecD [Alphaproteobacteria bacterium]
MLRTPLWKTLLILAVSLWSVAYSLPTFVSADTLKWMQDNLPAGFPKSSVNLGLDLRGGAHLLLEVDMDYVYKERADMLEQDLRQRMVEKKIGYSKLGTILKGARVTLKEAKDAEAVRGLIRAMDSRYLVTTSEDGLSVEAVMDAAQIKEIQGQVLGQSIEIVRRRVDQLGTTEPTIQRQGDNRVLLQVPGADSNDIKRIIGRTAKLGFHLVDQSGARSAGDMTLPMVEEPGQKMNVKRRAIITGDMLDNAQPSFDQNGRTVVSFRLNSTGARKFCDASRSNVGKPFAIVLDNEIISAPVIQEAICGGQGQISGNFSVQEANDLSVLLRAGALPAPMTIAEERTVGPSLGADSVAAGKTASLFGLLFVMGFMMIAYGLFGFFAVVALFINVLMILALLSVLQATLTLPGIAGIVLTMGMAVDANVLIFERIREELRAGRSNISAIDTGYGKAMATIVDSNLTTLIPAAILFAFGTGPIKGFAVTISIGILTSMFSAVMITRLMVLWWLRRSKPGATVPV